MLLASDDVVFQLEEVVLARLDAFIFFLQFVFDERQLVQLLDFPLLDSGFTEVEKSLNNIR